LTNAPAQTVLRGVGACGPATVSDAAVCRSEPRRRDVGRDVIYLLEAQHTIRASRPRSGGSQFLGANFNADEAAI
jgi:hypothetical protein